MPNPWRSYWAELLGKPVADVQKMLARRPSRAARSKLAKQGGLGTHSLRGHLSPVDDFVDWSWRAAPSVVTCSTYQRREADAQAMLDCLTAKGCAGLNIIPTATGTTRTRGQALNVASCGRWSLADAMGCHQHRTR